MFRKILTGSVCCAVLAATLLVPGAKTVTAQGGAFSQMLALVPDDALSRTQIWYGSLSELNSVLDVQINSRSDVDSLPQDKQFDYLYEIGQQVYYSAFSGIARAPEWQQTFGINSFAITHELTVGKEPQQYGLLRGNFDVGAVTGALQALGYQPAQVGNSTIFALGNDNAPPGGPVSQLAGAAYNRLSVTGNQIIAAPSTALIQTVLAGGDNLFGAPAYAALASVLEGGSVVPNSRLLSAALFDGAFLIKEIGSTNQNPPLPAYQAAGVGYRRGSNSRAVVFALAYADQNTAAQAGAILVARLNDYVSIVQPGLQVFGGWAFAANVANVNGLAVLVVTGRAPAQTDVAWVKMVQDRDIAFLAAQ